MERTENLDQYHDVVARSHASIINSIWKDNKTDLLIVKTLLIYNIKQAFILWKMEHEKQTKLAQIEADIEKMKLNDQEIDRLVNMMFYYESLAGIKPVQTRKQKASRFSEYGLE